MSDIRISRELKFGTVTVEVIELTVAEIRAWIAEGGTTPVEREYDMFTDLIAFDGISVQDMKRFSNITDEVISTLSPSHLSRIAAVIKETNSVFFNQYLPALEKLRETVREQRLAENQEELVETQNEDPELTAPIQTSPPTSPDTPKTK